MKQLSFFTGAAETQTCEPYRFNRTPPGNPKKSFTNPKLKPFDKDAEDLFDTYHTKVFESVHGKASIFDIWYTYFRDESPKLHVRLGTLKTGSVGVQIFSSRQHFEDYFKAYQ